MQVANIAEFSVIRQIAHGGQAKIYECQKDGNSHAIKIYDRFDEKSNFLFQKETELIGSIYHKGILSPLEYRRKQSITLSNKQVLQRNIVIMKYKKNGDLMNQVINNGRMQSKLVLPLVKHILQCLIYLNERNIFHCDLKAQNILLDTSFKPLLIDFGFMDNLSSAVNRQSPRQFYIAPEIKKGVACSQKSQIFSLGVLIFILATGMIPFKWTKHTDVQYRSLLQGKTIYFWKHFEQNLKISLQQNLKKAISNLLQPNPKRRWSYKDLQESEWFNEESLSQKQIIECFMQRHGQKLFRNDNQCENQFTDYILTDNQELRYKQICSQNMQSC